MNEIAQALALNDFLLWIWRSGVWVSAALMLALSALVFIRPALIHRRSGTMLAITAIPMLFLHRFQRRQAARAVPFTKRIVPLMDILGVALGGLIMWAIS